jgi:hypothetical protein
MISTVLDDGNCWTTRTAALLVRAGKRRDIVESIAHDG